MTDETGYWGNEDQESTASPWTDVRINSMRCQSCYRDDGIDFLVSNKTWNLVVTGEHSREAQGSGVLCLECFDKRALVAGIEYRDEVVVFGMFAWQAGTYEGGMPE